MRVSGVSASSSAEASSTPVVSSKRTLAAIYTLAIRTIP